MRNFKDDTSSRPGRRQGRGVTLCRSNLTEVPRSTTLPVVSSKNTIKTTLLQNGDDHPYHPDQQRQRSYEI